MKVFIPVFIIILILGAGTYGLYRVYESNKEPEVIMTDSQISQTTSPLEADRDGKSIDSPFRISSTAFEENQEIPTTYTCKGSGFSPPLIIDNIPVGTRELALIIDDPDAPSGIFTHWILWNISPETSEISENSTPAGAIEGKTSLNQIGYVPPCPPSGSHRYLFKLYALSEPISLNEGSTKGQLVSEMEGKVLQQAELVGLVTNK